MAVRWQSLSYVLLAAALSLAGGCFNSPDLSKIACTSGAHCPAGYACVRPSSQQVGLCERTFNSGDAQTTAPIDGAVAPDVAAPLDGPADRAAGNFDQGPTTNSVDSADASAVGLDSAGGVDDVAQRPDLSVGVDGAGGGNDVPPRLDTAVPDTVRDAPGLDSSLPDAPIQTPDAALTCPATCVNNDGCCPTGCNANTDNDCKAVCNNGVIEPGETCDPLSTCTAASQACVSDSSTVRTGKGDAKACTFVCQETARQCGTADGYCPAGCSNPPDPDCPKANGQSCATGTECFSGFCASGVCCNSACTGACEQCAAASVGQCAYQTGKQCLAASNCTNASVCSGSSSTCPAPTPKAAGTACGTVTCSGSTQSGPTCDGAGSCGASANKECYPYACASGSGCKTSCATNADCVSGNSSFCGKTGVCTVDSKCWHATDGSATPPLWQVNPKEPTDPDAGPYTPQYHRYDTPGSTPDDVCNALTLCGFDDWAVPTIDELRSLVQGCPSTVTGGSCAVTNACLTTACNSGCDICDNMAGPGSQGCYLQGGLNGPCSLYWSSSIYFDPDRGSYRYRFIGFSDGNLWSCDPSDGNYVRCVRRSQ